MADTNLISVGTLRQFLVKLRSTFAAAVHTHNISDVTGLNTALQGKANAVHNHTINEITALQTALNGKQDAGEYLTAETDPSVPTWVKSITEEQIRGWDNAASGEIEETDPTVPSYVKSIQQTDISKWNTALQEESDPTVPSWAKADTKPTYTYSEVGAAPTVHTHAIADVSGLQNALDNKQAKGDYLTAENVTDALPEWAQGGSKPTYTYTEVGAAPASVATDLTAHTGDKTIHITSEERNQWNGKADLGDIPTSLKNPTAITIDVNGTQTTYDGSEAKTVTVTADALGVTASLNNKADKPVPHTYTASTTHWGSSSPYRTTQTYDAGATSDADIVLVSPTPEYISKWAEFGLYAAQESSGAVYIATTKNAAPTEDVEFYTVLLK